MTLADLIHNMPGTVKVTADAGAILLAWGTLLLSAGPMIAAWFSVLWLAMRMFFFLRDRWLGRETQADE